MDCFITGTDTGAGKTYVTCALLQALSNLCIGVAALKPIAAGFESYGTERINEDVYRHRANASVPLDPAIANPYAFEAPTAPHLAAALEGREVELSVIEHAFERAKLSADIVIVEGVGGWCLPINPEQMQADLVRQLRLPVVMVAGIRLGGLNHGLLTARAIEGDGCELIGWVANIVDPEYVYAEKIIDSLLPRIPAPMLGRLTWEPEEANRETHHALADAIATLSRPRKLSYPEYGHARDPAARD